MLEMTQYSKDNFKEAKEIVKKNNIKDDIVKAYYYYVLICFSFSNLKIGLGINVNNLSLKSFSNKLRYFYYFHKILKRAQIDNRDYKKVIEVNDRSNSFFYIDPPYPNADQSAYDSDVFTKDRFQELLDILQTIKGRFIVSYYDNFDYKKNNSWKKYYFNVDCKVSNQKGVTKREE